MVARIMDVVRPFRAGTLGNVTKAITPRWKPGDATSQFVGAVSNAVTYSTGRRSSLSIVEASTIISTTRLRGIELALEITISSGVDFAV